MSGFSCREPQVNDYLKQHALKNSLLGVSQTYVLEEDGHIVGLITICGTAVQREGLPENIAVRMPRYPLPALLIAWLGVDIEHEGKGHSKTLIRFALAEAAHAYRATGCIGVFVDAMPSAKTLYAPYGFIEVDLAGDGDELSRQFLEIGSIIDAISSQSES